MIPTIAVSGNKTQIRNRFDSVNFKTKTKRAL